MHRRIIIAFLIVSTSILYAQNMGVKLPPSTTPNTTLDVNGSVAYREGTALSLVNGVNSDVTLGDFSFYRITGPTTAFSVTGFTGGQNGRVLTIINASTQTMTLTHQATSSPSNQINTGGSNITVAANGVALLVYNSTLASWVVSGGNGFTNTTNTVWNVTGNSGTTAGTHFIGTTDGQGLAFRTNNTERMRILSGGNVGIGIPSPSNTLHVSAPSNPVRFEGLQTGASSDNMLTADATGVIRQVSFPQYVDIEDLTGTSAIAAGSVSASGSSSAIGSTTVMIYSKTFTIFRTSLLLVDASVTFVKVENSSSAPITDGSTRLLRSHWSFNGSTVRYGACSNTFTNTPNETMELSGFMVNNNGFNTILAAGTYTLELYMTVGCSSGRTVMTPYGNNIHDRISIKAIQLQ